MVWVLKLIIVQKDRARGVFEPSIKYLTVKIRRVKVGYICSMRLWYKTVTYARMVDVQLLYVL